MATTYLVTGLDTGQPRLDYTGVLTGHKVGDTFTTTLDPALEQKLIGAGILAIEPLPAAVTSAGTPDASGKVLTSTAAGSNEGAWLPSSGGSGSSGLRVIRCPFAHDTADLLTGATLYTPIVGDYLIDAWVDIFTAFDGTTPKGDIGQLLPNANHIGWFSDGSAVLDMTRADYADVEAGTITGDALAQPGLRRTDPQSSLVTAFQVGFAPDPHRSFPARFLSTDPIKIWVTQNGLNTGADPASTQGSGVVCFLVATPIAP